MPFTIEVCGELVRVTDAVVEKFPTLVELLTDLPSDSDEVVPVPWLSVSEFRAVLEHVELGRPLALRDERAAAYLGLGEGSVETGSDGKDERSRFPSTENLQKLASLKSPYANGNSVPLLDELERCDATLCYADEGADSLNWYTWDGYTRISVAGLSETTFSDPASASYGDLPCAMLNHHLATHPLLVGNTKDKRYPALDRRLISYFGRARLRIERSRQLIPNPTQHYWLEGHRFNRHVRISGEGQFRLYIYGQSAMGRPLPDDALPFVTLEWHRQDELLDAVDVDRTFLHDIYLSRNERGLLIRPRTTFSNVQFYLVVAIPQNLDPNHYIGMRSYHRVVTDLDEK